MQPLVVVGPTAAGKTDLAVGLARRLGGEVIGADSRQVYRLLDIGTAKPTAAEQRAARHHLIDVVMPDEPFGLADYLEHARAALADVQARGHLPIVCGGTGQYVWALVEGWQVPRVPPDTALRVRLEQRAAHEGHQALHAELAAIDPLAAAAIDARNVRRVIRALEIWQLTGQLPSRLRSRRSDDPPPLIIGAARERSELYERIDRRVQAMFADGLLEEIRRLLQAGYAPALPSLSGIGYAQGIEHLRGAIDTATAVARTQAATHRLARQQGAWFRAGDPRITWLLPDDIERAVATVERWLASRPPDPLERTAAR